MTDLVPEPVPEAGPDAGPEPGPDAVPDAGWRRLDSRMLLVHPINELIRFLPLLIGLFILGTSGSSEAWHYLGVLVPITIGLLRFASTRFRITGTQIDLRRGILSRSLLTAPLDRVRTVELTAKPIHRILGLAKVEIGTGSVARDGDGQLVLDSLGAAEAQRLRVALLHRTAAPAADPGTTPFGPETVLVRFDPSWVRYAPLTMSGLVIALAAIAASSQLLGEAISAGLDVTDVDEQVGALPLLVAVPVGLIVVLVVISVLAMIGYLLTNWGFLLTRNEYARTFHVRRGLLTTRETSIDLDRFRGVELHEPLGLRLVGAGRLAAVVTGLRRGSENSSPLVPPAPRSVAVGVGELVLGEHGPLYAPLFQHGEAARRRRYIRGVVGMSLVPLALLVLVLGASWPAWTALLGLLAPVAGVFLARDRYDRLGHNLTPGYVVIRQGSLRGRRDALQRTGIIGWNITQSWFQRRAGLVNLVATTAAGQQAYEILDIREADAVAFAHAAVPGLVEQFLT